MMNGMSLHLYPKGAHTGCQISILAETSEDIVQLAAFSSPACRGVWINRLYLVPTGTGSLTDGSGSYPVPLDAHLFRVVVRTVQIAASLGGFIDAQALEVPLSALVNLIFALLRANLFEYKHLD